MQERLDELRKLIWHTPQSPSGISLIEEAIHISDTLGDAKNSNYYRKTLIGDCTEYGQVMKALVAFSWYMPKVKDGTFPFRDIVWEYRAILSRMALYDMVSRK